MTRKPESSLQACGDLGDCRCGRCHDARIEQLERERDELRADRAKVRQIVLNRYIGIANGVAHPERKSEARAMYEIVCGEIPAPEVDHG